MLFTVDHLKRLTREIATVKYDMRQALSLLDILVDKSNRSTECENTRFSYKGAENRFPLETRAQLTEIEEILKTANSQENTEIDPYFTISRILIEQKYNEESWSGLGIPRQDTIMKKSGPLETKTMVHPIAIHQWKIQINIIYQRS
ncbi:uncharacterized protein LOC114940968 [Nylanderia fulva]|uniref:uncharacterized protein LOC114940968 n=1 Tax=Nylanderia fulva TaxID=613905 RepID=UPI0010FB40E8|nr:uncharacterized protein LOC114940968 [Nylanderia fulva]